MTKREHFIKFFDDLTKEVDITKYPEVNEYYATIKAQSEKPLFTDNGKIILSHLKTQNSEIPLTSKRIAEEIGMSAKTVAGAMRKLVTDNFVEKTSVSPSTYMITEKGKNINIV